MKRLFQVDEAEVIAGFLRNEFYEPEFDRDRAQFDSLVTNPDLKDAQQNALRRALLFRRRGHMWRELPRDTQWWRVQPGPEDIQRIRIFARAQWLWIGRGDFRAETIVRRIRTHEYPSRVETFVQKIQRIRGAITRTGDSGPVLLIGVDDANPLTVLEGNHRVAAALLDSYERFAGLNFYCGYSPNMAKSCWYRTNLPSLWRYLKNRLRNVRDYEADIDRVLRETVPPATSAPASANEVGGSPWKQDSELLRARR
jgi:hypothetical protein